MLDRILFQDVYDDIYFKKFKFIEKLKKDSLCIKHKLQITQHIIKIIRTQTASKNIDEKLRVEIYDLQEITNIVRKHVGKRLIDKLCCYSYRPKGRMFFRNQQEVERLIR